MPRDLEKSLGMGLELGILKEYVALKMWRYSLALYYGFEVIILALALAVAWGNAQLEALGVIGPVMAIIAIYGIEALVERSRKGLKKTAKAD